MTLALKGSSADLLLRLQNSQGFSLQSLEN